MKQFAFRFVVAVGLTSCWGAAFAQAVVPTQAIRSQTLITALDVSIIPGDYPGAIKDVGAVIGREARVSLYPGRPITFGDIGAPAVLVRNQIVTMIYDIGGLRITADGRALDRAGPGELVRIMNIDSRATVTGLVRPDGSVEVGSQ